ncbi:sensor domain-containing protein [Streptomyces sp. NBC_01102]|uniref:sensor domain-containing protein n=1 Tax=Streptomyces sp. NBC_01102 TaxID=2903749 RepID=UPI00386694FE|nr:sensor domain-containing protein [Streptomyces sp. NBC_01102]
MTKHYWNQNPAAPAPPTWQQTPRAVPPQLGRGGAAPSTPVQPAAGTGTQPPPAAQAARRGNRVLRHWRLLVAAMMPCLLLAGIGWWLWPQPSASGPPHIAEGTVQADLLSADSVSKLAGTAMVAGPQSNRPHAPLTVTPSECAIAAGPTTQSVYGQAWKAFLSATYQDAAGSGSYTVNQVIGVFPDSKKATAAFRTLADGLTKCPSSTLTDQAGRTSKWAYTAHPATEVAVAWTATQGDTANWACYHQARVKGASLIHASVCQAGDGEPTVSMIADELTGKVTG